MNETKGKYEIRTEYDHYDDLRESFDAEQDFLSPQTVDWKNFEKNWAEKATTDSITGDDGFPCEILREYHEYSGDGVFDVYREITAEDYKKIRKKLISG